MTSPKKIGDRGEQLAVQYLIDNGFNILEQNYRFKRSEVDIIVEKDGFIVFVEVKTRKDSFYGNPEDFVNDQKADMVHLAAENYLLDKNPERPIRFDIISIIDSGKSFTIEHFQDAF